LERRRLEQAPLLLPLSEGGLAEAPLSSAACGRALVVPLAVERSGPLDGPRDIAAITYAANPRKKGLDRVLGAWRQARRTSERADEQAGELLVAGVDAEELLAAGFELAGEPGVRVLGRLAGEEFRGLLRRSRVFLCAPRREDYGAAQLEALADGCLLVSTPAPGPYAALPIARELDARLIDEDLARALTVALREPPPAAEYAAGAARALRPLAADAIDRRVAEELLPRLLG
jgi:hypothetical protein